MFVGNIHKKKKKTSAQKYSGEVGHHIIDSFSTDSGENLPCIVLATFLQI